MKLLIIGAGPGGYETALAAAAKGLEVTLVSAGPVGGTCLNEGCIPTKSLCRSAEVLELARRAAEFGVNGCGPELDFGKVMSRKAEVIDTLRKGVEFMLNKAGVNVVYGRASFVSDDRVRVALEDGGETELTADRIIIATGSYSASLNIPGKDLPGVVMSREMLSLDAVPSSLCIIGGGVIGLEFASIFASFGTEVTVLEYCNELLPHFDKDLAKRLKSALSKRGIKIETAAKVCEIDSVADGLEVRYEKKEKMSSVDAGKVLMAVGRRPMLDGLGLENTAVEFSPKGVKVDAEMRTSVPDIYAIGDVTGGIMLAHVATAQGEAALSSILGEPVTKKFDVVPATVFTMPEVASVGQTEEDCEAKGIEFSVRKSMYRANGKAVSMGEPDGFCKLVCSPDGKLLGCHIMGAHASDLIHEAAAFIGSDITSMHALIHAHPTLSEVLLAAAE